MYLLLKNIRLVLFLAARARNQDGYYLTVAQMIIDLILAIAIGDLLVFHLWLKAKGLTTY